MTPSLTNSARNDRRTCYNRENWNPCTTYLYNVLCNSLLWTKCRNLGKCQIGPMALQTNLGFWKLYAKSIHAVQYWFYELHNEWDYLADNMQHQHLQCQDYVILIRHQISSLSFDSQISKFPNLSMCFFGFSPKFFKTTKMNRTAFWW